MNARHSLTICVTLCWRNMRMPTPPKGKKSLAPAVSRRAITTLWLPKCDAASFKTALALMDGGVPIKRPVGGIAMGLMSDGDKFVVLTDIQGLEDHIGDMDFKVAGTEKGITALQMDIKIKGISDQVLAQALEQARDARMQILKVMLDALPESRKNLSQFAPLMNVIKIDPDKIGAIIGPGGKTIRAPQEKYGVKIDIEVDGTVFVFVA